MTDWVKRNFSKDAQPGRRSTWAAVAMALVSVVAQVVDVVMIKTDVAPTLERIERRLEDHEKRIQALEEKGARTGDESVEAERPKPRKRPAR